MKLVKLGALLGLAALCLWAGSHIDVPAASHAMNFAAAGSTYMAMAVVTGYGNGYKDPAAINAAKALFAEGRVRMITSKVAVANGDSVNSVYNFGKVPSNSVLDPASAIYYTALGAGALMQLGVGTSAAALMAAQDVSAAGSQTIAGKGTVTAANMAKQAWELAGLTSDPGGTLDVYGTLTGAAAAAGSVTAAIKYAKA